MTRGIRWTLIVLGLASLAALFLALRPSAVAPQPTSQALLPPEALEPLQIELRIEQGQRTEGPEMIRVRQGERLSLRVLSDQDDELHLHGYDLRLVLRANMPAQLDFTARHSGRFEYELHGAHRTLGTLEVLPP
jgi:FtsP/CotA-like multicopper oxidase with cupredoxin domain